MTDSQTTDAAGDRPTVTCPECGAEQETDPAHAGETSRGTTCPSCGEWFSVDLDALRDAGYLW